MVEIGLGRCPGRFRDALHGPQDAPGHDPAQPQGHNGSGAEGDPGLDELLTESVVDGVVDGGIVHVGDELEDGAAVPGSELAQALAVGQAFAERLLHLHLGEEGPLFGDVVPVEGVPVEEVGDGDEHEPGQEKERPVEEGQADADGGLGEPQGALSIR